MANHIEKTPAVSILLDMLCPSLDPSITDRGDRYISKGLFPIDG